MTNGRKQRSSQSSNNSFRPSLTKVGWVDQEINNSSNEREKNNRLPELVNAEDLFRDKVGKDNTKTHLKSRYSMCGGQVKKSSLDHQKHAANPNFSCPLDAFWKVLHNDSSNRNATTMSGRRTRKLTTIVN